MYASCVCYSEKGCAKFKEFSGGRVAITSSNVLRQAIYDEVSSDGDSVTTSHPLDRDSSDALSSYLNSLYVFFFCIFWVGDRGSLVRVGGSRLCDRIYIESVLSQAN